MSISRSRINIHQHIGAKGKSQLEGGKSAGVEC